MQPGQHLGHYEILEKIGEGGMGAVWKAKDTRLGRLVALKALSSRMLTDDGRRRLMQEARAASILQHPNIVTLHDVGSHDGIDFLVMEYVAGETLDQRIQRTGPLPPDEMLRIGMALASALSHAHNHGLIHRDLKPANVILTAEGTAKLLDFGLAKRLWTETAPENDVTQTQLALTEEGAIVGTISYMSPEQAEGRPLDARSDIFSLGAVLYEMASGRRAFDGPNKLSTLTAILRDEPKPLEQIVKDTPQYVTRSVVRCLRKLPEERYPNAAELEKDLGSTPAPPPPEAPPVRRERPRWMVPAIAAVWVVAIGVAASLLWKADPQPVVPTGVKPGKTITVTPFTSTPAVETHPRWSPDGNRLAYQSGGELFTKEVATGNIVPLGRSENYTWAPDGQRLAVVRGGKIVIVPGGDRIAEATVEPRASLAWSPDGSTIVFSQPGGADTANLIAMTLADRSQHPLTPSRGAYSDIAPSYSPDGKQVAYISRYSNIRATVRVVPAAGGADRQVGPEYSQLIGVDWSGDGRSLYFTGTRDSISAIWHVAADGNSASPVHAITNGRYYQVSAARTGPLRIATPQSAGDIVLIEEH
jgi:serine/threonine protein kinase